MKFKKKIWHQWNTQYGITDNTHSICALITLCHSKENGLQNRKSRIEDDNR
jgi:hypothetical protein